MLTNVLIVENHVHILAQDAPHVIESTEGNHIRLTVQIVENLLTELDPLVRL